MEPGAGQGPQPVGLPARKAEGFRCLAMTQAGEEAEFNQFGGGSVVPFEFGQGFVQGEEFFRAGRAGRIIQLHASAFPAAFLGLPGSGMIDQNAAHGLGGRPEERAPRLERLLRAQTEVGLMNQGRGVQGMVRPFRRQLG